MKYEAILFDLDGTLTNSEPGITSCVTGALEKMNFPVPPRETLRKFIGPPLWSSFMDNCGMTEGQAEQAVEFYRETYNVIGAYQNAPYPGIMEMLEVLKRTGIKLAVATSKPRDIALPVLDHFGLTPYFDYIAAADPDDHESDKTRLICSGLKAFSMEPRNAVMVGDTRFDAAGARGAGTQFIGALYGFGTQEEMENEGAALFAATVSELQAMLLAQ